MRTSLSQSRILTWSTPQCSSLSKLSNKSSPRTGLWGDRGNLNLQLRTKEVSQLTLKIWSEQRSWLQSMAPMRSIYSNILCIRILSSSWFTTTKLQAWSWLKEWSLKTCWMLSLIGVMRNLVTKQATIETKLRKWRRLEKFAPLSESPLTLSG